MTVATSLQYSEYYFKGNLVRDNTIDSVQIDMLIDNDPQWQPNVTNVWRVTNLELFITLHPDKYLDATP